MTAFFKKTSQWKRIRLRTSKKVIQDALQERLQRVGWTKVFHGLMSKELPSYMGKDFVYVDNPYFLRYDNERPCCRVIRAGFHVTKPLDRPDDRWKTLGIDIHPWKKNGRSVVIIPPTDHFVRLYNCKDWLPKTFERISKETDRRVLVKWNKYDPSLEVFLHECKAHVVVTYGSVAGVEAAIHGYPVYSGPICPTAPISAGNDIENPIYQDREPWLHGLAYANWFAHELKSLNLEDYNYR